MFFDGHLSPACCGIVLLPHQIEKQRQYLQHIWRDGRKGSVHDYGLLPNYFPKHLVSLGGSRQVNTDYPGFATLQKHIYLLVLCLQPCSDERFPPGGSSVPLPGVCSLSQFSSGSHGALSAAPSHGRHPQAHPATEAPAAGPAELEQPPSTRSLLQLSNTEGCRFFCL